MSVNKGGFGPPPAGPARQKPGDGAFSSSSSSSLTPPATSRQSLSDDAERVIASVRDRKVEAGADTDADAFSTPTRRGRPDAPSRQQPEPPQLRKLSTVLGHPCAGSDPQRLQRAAFEHVRRLGSAALASFINETVLPSCRHLDEAQCQGLLQGIVRGQLHLAGTGLSAARVQALMQLVTQGAAVFSLPQQLQVLESLCVLLGAADMALDHVEVIVAALCTTTGVHDPSESSVLMEALARRLGGLEMPLAIGARIQSVIVHSGCLPEQLGAMVIGLADTLQGPARRATPDAGLADADPSYFTPVLAAAADLTAPQLARWGLGCAVATRMDLDSAAEALGAAVLACGERLSPAQLTALGLGIATGLGDGRVGKAIVDRLWPVLENADLDVSGPFHLGLAMAVYPLTGIVRAESPSEMAQWVFALPRVLDARTTPQQLERILSLDTLPHQRVALLEALLQHGGQHLGVPAFRQARDEALRQAPDRLGPLYAAFVRAGLPTQVFPPAAGTPAQTGDGLELSAARRTLLDRLAFVWQESAFVSASAASPGDKQAALAVLGELETALSMALPPTDVKSATAQVSAPAAR